MNTSNPSDVCLGCKFTKDLSKTDVDIRNFISFFFSVDLLSVSTFGLVLTDIASCWYLFWN